MSLSQYEELSVTEKCKFEDLIRSANIIQEFRSKLSINDDSV